MKYWHHKTSIGTFYVVEYQSEYDIIFEGKYLGSFGNPQQAVDAIICGNTTLSSLYNPGTLGLPEKIEEWQQG